ncbi:MAG TPA: hypothetical protein VK783_09215 [Bacteroidia bacterium]|jgi:hypothetical protein|nr:hypothetical protein [Bacteroidia bacterium]
MKKLPILLLLAISVSLTAQITPAPAPAPAPVAGPGAAPMPAPAPAPVVGPGASQMQAPPPQPVTGPGANQMPMQQAPVATNPTNVDYTNQILYMDDMGQPRTARLNPPPMVQSAPPGAMAPPTTVQWTIYNGSGMVMGSMFEGFRYRGDNGAGYETRVVLLQTGDPNKPYEARFQSRRMGTMEYRDGRVIVLDWQNNPWVVKPEYTNDRGIIFKFHPYQQGE